MPDVWRWDDDLASDPVHVRESWVSHGKHAPVEPSETRVHAILARFGPLLRWTVDTDGCVLDGPHAERESVRVLFVTSDGTRATERCFDAVRGPDGWKPDRSEFLASYGAAEDLSEVTRPESRRRYRTLLRELHDIVEETDSGVTA